jgi:uncharacterized RDD family membrane protein YckC
MQQPWYVGVDGTPRGPYEREAVTRLCADGTFDTDALVWSEGMPGWVSLTEAGLAPVLSPPEPLPPLLPPPLPPSLPARVPARSAFDWPLPGDILADPRDRPPSVSVDDDGWQSLDPLPWSRYFGRTIDTLLIGLALWAIIGILIESIDPPLFHRLDAVGGLFHNKLVTSILTFSLVIPLQALLIGLTGSTPGKWVFGVRITRRDGRPIGIVKALRRELDVFARGLGLGVPLVGFITQIASYKTLVRERESAWDAGRPWVVTYRSQGSMQITLFAFGLLIWAATIVYIRTSSL